MPPHYSLKSFFVAICILYQLILIQTSKQVSLQKRNLHDLSKSQNLSPLNKLADEDATTKAWANSYIVLMSHDTISVARLPMILDGNLSDIFSLADQENELTNLDNDDAEETASRFAIKFSDNENEDDDDSSAKETPRKWYPHDAPAADGREHEQQMPHMMSGNVNTSLGKSEWQQIAGLGHRERNAAAADAVLESQAALNRKSGAFDWSRQKDDGAKKAGEEGRQLGRPRREEARMQRRRRSNVSSDYGDDSATMANGPSAATIAVEASGTKETENNTSDAQTPREAKESKMQNVTSASQASVEQQQQQQESGKPNLASAKTSRGRASAEDGDKTVSPPLDSSSWSPPAAAPMAATSSFEPGTFSSRVQFSDFDVHMSLGYAFVADTAGRIHRFKLPMATTASLSLRSSLVVHTSDSSSLRRNSGFGENNGSRVGSTPLAENDDATNIIDAGSKFEFISRQSRVAERADNTSSALVNANHDANSNVNHHHGSNEGDVDGYTNRILENPFETDKVRGRQSSVVAQGRTENERLHPTISGGGIGERLELESQRSEKKGPLPSNSALFATSGATRDAASRQQSSIYGSRVENKQVDATKPRTIWTRGRYARARTPQSDNGARAYSTKHEKQQQLANDEGALSANTASRGNQLPNAQAKTSGRHYQETPPSPLLQSDDQRQPTRADRNGEQLLFDGGGDAIGRAAKQEADHKHPSFFQTEIAVDWLNNLLYVLDKCRLLVMDFDGNLELVLIDDFNANNRPVDIKVDPVNDFLFWLRIGKFHNTIYKLDLSVLSLPSTSHKLVANTLRLRQSAQSNASDNNFDASDLVPLVSHHYAHPIITNLPRNTRTFTIDHKHSRIYVPLTLPPTHLSTASANDEGSKIDLDTNIDKQFKRVETSEDTEIFASPSDDSTHLNNTQTVDSLPSALSDDGADCARNSEAQSSSGTCQILAYNLDGTDVGPFRTFGERAHLNNLDDIQDLTLNSNEGLLYWLTNDGSDLLEEFKENSSIQPAQHSLNGKKYLKLLYIDNNEKSNQQQPTTQKSRFNVRKIIQMLSSSISPNRQVRSGFIAGLLDADNNDPAVSMGVRHSESNATRHTPYIILGVTCLIVTTVYLIYALIFTRIRDNHRTNEIQSRTSVSGRGAESITSESSMGEVDSHVDENSNGFVQSSTISRWVGANHSIRCNTVATSTFERDVTNFNQQIGAYDLESSTIYEASNAIDEHYRDNANHIDSMLKSKPDSRLANLSEWPSNTHDLSNKLYIPVEVLQDEALSSIKRVAIDQLEIERRAPLGEGHFGTVLQGTIDCTKNEMDYLLARSRMNAPCEAPISPDSLAPPSRSRMFAPSTSSSGHGSSSSTSCEFASANTCSDAVTGSHDDYLTPKNQLSNTSSDYGVGLPTATVYSPGDNLSGYGEVGTFANANTSTSVLSKQRETKLRVAIKKLKDNANLEEKRDFLQEAKLLANFDHPNIVHLIGICLDRGTTLIVMELMLGGDLIRYMKENTPNRSNNYTDDLTYDELLKICLDIANGCCYLESMDYIHRDLAARNCLVSSRKREERVVKLADFGLARDIYKNSYYKKMNDSAMPLKWMAPECLIEQKFTKKSDVWSFGVVMWEVMNYCQEKPYSDVEPFLMKDYLASGRRLDKPNSCDDCMYKLMLKCWEMNPELRPTFHECKNMLIEIRSRGRL